MTTVTIVILNVILAVAVLAGMLTLLGGSILSSAKERRPRRPRAGGAF